MPVPVPGRPLETGAVARSLARHGVPFRRPGPGPGGAALPPEAADRLTALIGGHYIREQVR